jgi:iron complex outermembrane receptor protein
MRSGRSQLWLVLLVVLLFPSAGPAQDEGAPDPSPDAGQLNGPETLTPEGVESITITGKQESAADIQDEAKAITAFTADDLDRANIVNIDSLALNVPGLHVGQSGQQAIVTLRGIGTENASITGEPGVAFQVDGVNFAQPAAARVSFFDLETLDVKLGPQGLAGGKNSTSGTINVITRKPSDEFEIDGDVTFGNYDRVRGRGALNVPLTEFAAARLALYYEDRDGYLDNKFVSDSRDPFDVDDFGLRGHLRLNPTDSLEVLLSYNYYRQDGNGPQADVVPIARDVIPCVPALPNTIDAPLGNNAGPSVMPPRSACNFETIVEQGFVRDPTTGRPVFVPQVDRFRPASEDPDPRAVYADFLASQKNRFWGWTGHIDWDVPELPGIGETRLKLLGGFQDTDQQFDYDSDTTDLEFTQLLTERGAYQYSAELQWSGTLGERLDWQTGGLYARERGFRNLERPPTRSTQAPFVGIEQETENTNYGAWLSGTYSVGDSVRLSLGGRWIKDKKRAYLLRSSPDAGEARDRFIGCNGSLLERLLPDFSKVPFRPNPWCSETFRGTMWGAGIDWRPWNSSDHLLFARIDRGYKSGGFRAGGRGDYKPEKNWAYSVGSKSEFFDGRLQINLDAFFYKYTDLQLVVLDELVLRTENTDAEMYGWDLKAVAMPFAGMRLEATISNLHTETIDYYTLDPANLISANANVDPEVQFDAQRLVVRDQTENYDPEDLGGVTYVDSFNCLSPPPNPRQGFRCGDTGDKDGLDDFSGNQLSRAPEWKIMLAAEYEIPMGRFGSLTPRVQYTWQDDTYFRTFNRDFDLQEAYHLTDAKLIWISPEQSWHAEVFVTNIEDEAPIQNLFVGARSNGSPPVAWWGVPRMYGFRLGFRY